MELDLKPSANKNQSTTTNTTIKQISATIFIPRRDERSTQKKFDSSQNEEFSAVHKALAGSIEFSSLIELNF